MIDGVDNSKEHIAEPHPNISPAIPILVSETQKKQKGPKSRFKPGVSGNPGGRPKGTKNALTEIEDAINKYVSKEGKSYWGEATIIAMDLAKKGNVSLLCKILDKFVASKDQEEEKNPFDKQLPIVKLYADSRN